MTKVTDRYLDERRQEILDAARRVFVSKGYAAATINDIALEAGVAAGSIYRYFNNKADLIDAAAGACVQDDMDTWRNAPPVGGTPGEALLALGASVKANQDLAEHRDLCILRLESYLAAARDPELQGRITETLHESVEGIAEYIQAAQQSGEFDASIDAHELSHFLHAFGAGVGAMSTVFGPEFSGAQAWDLMIRFVGTAFSDELLARVAATQGVGTTPGQ